MGQLLTDEELGSWLKLSHSGRTAGMLLAVRIGYTLRNKSHNYGPKIRKVTLPNLFKIYNIKHLGPLGLVELAYLLLLKWSLVRSEIIAVK